MATNPSNGQRDPADDARARAWVAEIQQVIERDELPDEGDYLDRLLQPPHNG